MAKKEKKEKDNEFTKTLRFHGISKRMLGEKMNLSQPTIRTYCENPSKFRLDQLRKIGQMTSMDITDLDQLIEDGDK